MKKEYCIHVEFTGKNPPEKQGSNESTLDQDKGESTDASTLLWTIKNLITTMSPLDFPLELSLHEMNHVDSVLWFSEQVGPYGEAL